MEGIDSEWPEIEKNIITKSNIVVIINVLDECLVERKKKKERQKEC